MNNINKSYLLWMLVFLGFAGIHRLYNRKILTGILWLLTFGLFGVGQIIDLFAIPGMVDEYNARLMFRRMFHNKTSSDRRS
ncbi:MAG: NINE protein [Cyanobacteria bacterium J06626_14]